MDEAAKKCAGGQHDCRRRECTAVAQPQPGRAAVRNEVVHLALDHREIGARPDRLLHGRGVELAIRLRARAAHRRALAAVEDAELDAACVRHAAHEAVKRVDLADEMAFAETADRGIAGHGADGREPVGDERRARAHARGGGRGLAAGMAATDDDHIEASVHRIFLQQGSVLAKAESAVKRPIGARVWGPCFT